MSRQRAAVAWNRWLASAIVAGITVAICSSCNHSRYGITYGTRLPSLKRVAVIVGSVDVYSLHSGGAREARPDMTETASDTMMDNLLAAISSQGIESTRVQQASQSTTSPANEPTRFALVSAVRDSIITHHYLFGNERLIDYSTGDLASVAADDESIDAVLWFHLTGVVPTEGRKALRTTAIVVGVLTGVHIIVDTQESLLILMLVDAKSGDVLWFNQERKKADVREAKDLKKLAKSATRYLLKPQN